MNKERPILFSTPMVLALLNTKPGTWPPEPIEPGKPFKWQTRRVVKPAKRNYEGFRQGNGLWIDGYGTEEHSNGHIKDYSVSSVWQRKDYYIKDFAPYKPGDILWVRETWASYCDECESNQGEGYEDATCAFGDCNRYAYKADNDGCPGGKWRPSIHMPREAARLFLTVKDVQIERLQDITEDDAKAEGVSAFIEFANLWDSAYSKRGYGWNANPWVWTITFERVV